MTIRYKLPPEFMAAHGPLVESWDWARAPQLSLARVLPDIPALKDVRLELVGIGAEQIVRPLGGGSALSLRRYNDTLPQHPKPTPEEVAEVLAQRNPPKEEQA